MFSHRIAAVLGGPLLLALVVTGLAPATSAPAEGCITGCLVGTAGDEFTADAVGLAREWIIQIPGIAGATQLSQVVVGDGLTVAQTSDGMAHAIASAPFPGGTAESTAPLPGSLLWSLRAGDAAGPSLRAGIGRDAVALPHLGGVTTVERATGQFRWQESFGDLPSAGAAFIGDWVYVTTDSDKIHRFAARPLRQPSADDGTAKAADAKGKKTPKKRQQVVNLAPVVVEQGGNGRVEITPTTLANGLLWCTADGLLVTLQPKVLDWQRLEYDLVNPPAGPPVTRDHSIYAATTAGDLARVDLPKSLKQLDLAWHTVLPGPAVTGPFLAGDTLVVSLGDLGIVAYSAETGAELWRSCLTGTILAVGGSRIWLIDDVGRLSAVDLADGSPRESLCLGPFKLPIVNTVSDRLILASPNGTIVCLAPRGGTGTPTPAVAPADAPATAEPAARTE
jgi:outer membrane protein assembly factor BamB